MKVFAIVFFSFLDYFIDLNIIQAFISSTLFIEILNSQFKVFLLSSTVSRIVNFQFASLWKFIL